MKKLALFLALALCLGACNTIDGVGKDISAAGQALDDAV